MQLQHKDHGNKHHQQQLQLLNQQQILDKDNKRVVDKKRQFNKINSFFYFIFKAWVKQNDFRQNILLLNKYIRLCAE